MRARQKHGSFILPWPCCPAAPPRACLRRHRHCPHAPVRVAPPRQPSAPHRCSLNKTRDPPARRSCAAAAVGAAALGRERAAKGARARATPYFTVLHTPQSTCAQRSQTRRHASQCARSQNPQHANSRTARHEWQGASARRVPGVRALAPSRALAGVSACPDTGRSSKYQQQQQQQQQ